MTPPKSKVRPHPFRRDPSIPPDTDGRVTCMCGLIDIPDDPRHTLPDAPPTQAEYRRRYEPDGGER